MKKNYKGGHVCAARHCKISSWRHKISFFRFPTDTNRAKIWAIACGREDLLNNLESLYNSYRLCGAHFDDHMFLNDLKNRLQPHANPTIFQNLESSSTSVFDHLYSASRGALLSVPNNMNLVSEKQAGFEKLPGRSLGSEVSHHPLINLNSEEQIVEKLSGDSLQSEDPDPLAITPADNLSLFGGSIENIEFVVESDEDGNDVETRADNIVIEIDDLEEQDIEEILNCKQVLNIPYPTVAEDQIIDLDELATNSSEVKEEIEVEETDVKSSHRKENEPTICEELEDVNQNDIHKLSCYVPGCKSNRSKTKEENVYWFNVPTDANLKKIWEICIGRVDKQLTLGELVCHKHFSEDDIVHKITVPSNDRKIFVPYNKPKLRQGAVPCITFHKECVVPTCGRDSGKMYCFPVLRMSDFHLWIYMIKNPILKNLEMKEVLRYRVCNLHFDTDCFDDDSLLKRTAAPTLYVPENYIINMASIKPIIQSDVLLICAYGECPNRSNTGKNVFRFPTVPEKCIAWLEACGRKNLISSPYATIKRMSQLRLGVCDDHFDYKDFDGSRGKLKPDAVPKPYLELSVDFRKSKSFTAEEIESSSVSSKASNISKKIFVNVVPGISNQKQTSIIGICCYKGCESVKSAVNPFFSFPVEKERFETWLKACGIQSPKFSSKLTLQNLQICGKHFEKDMFDSLNRLNYEANPINYNHNQIRVLDKMQTVASTSNIIKEQQTIGHTSKSTDSNTQNVITVLNQMQTVASTSNIIEEQQSIEYVSTSMDSNSQNVKEKQRIKLKQDKNIICCAVENCPNIYSSKFCKLKNLMFPNPNNDLQRYNIWLQLLANPQIKDLSQEELCTKYMVCVRHFETQFYQYEGKASRLSQEAVPTKNLTADHQWFFTSEYYKTRLQNYFDNLAIKDFPEDVIIEWKKEDTPNKNESEDKTRCVLEKDRIRFPGMEHYYYMAQSVNVTKRKIPYSVYNYFNTGYGLNNDVEVGENIRIHTAIIIDDNDDCEREVLQQLLDKRRKHS